MKIHIFGCSGSGKTWLANKLDKKYNLLHCDLDNLFWDNSQGTYGVRTPAEQRGLMLKEVLKQENWVVEGVYYAWVSESFEKADKIVVLDIPASITNFRIIRRFIRRKLGLETAKKETVRSLIQLLKWIKHFRKDNFPEAMELLQPYQEKVIVLRSVKEINAFASSDLGTGK
jgi:adenylate kinase family enzyme